MALHAAIGRSAGAGELAGVIETVPTMRSLMVSYDPLATSRAKLEPEIDALIARGLPASGPARHVSIPCCYDDPEFAPDLADVAKRTKKTTEQVIAGHLASPFKVYVLGFMPGLAYVAGLDQALYLPRRSQPRVRVPRSSVAIAMDMTTIYPFESPGGWHLIGRTPLWMFDQRREQPVFLAPGMPTAGAMDRIALSLANALVSNPANTAGLEIGVMGPDLLVEADSMRVALVGPLSPALIEGPDAPPKPVESDRTHLLKRGQVLRVGMVEGSSTAYLAVAGGFALPAFMGSLSTYARAGVGGFQGRKLAEGDALPLGREQAPPG